MERLTVPLGPETQRKTTNSVGKLARRLASNVVFADFGHCKSAQDNKLQRIIRAAQLHLMILGDRNDFEDREGPTLDAFQLNGVSQSEVARLSIDRLSELVIDLASDEVEAEGVEPCAESQPTRKKERSEGVFVRLADFRSPYLISLDVI